MAGAGPTRPVNPNADQDGWIGLGGLPDTTPSFEFQSPVSGFRVYNLQHKPPGTSIVPLLTGDFERAEDEFELDLDLYPLDRRHVLFPELRGMGIMSLFRGDLLDYVPPLPPAIDHSRNTFLIAYKKVVDEMEDWVAFRWLPSVETMLHLVEMAHSNPDRINEEIQRTSQTATWLTDVARQKIDLFVASLGFIRSPIAPKDLIHSIYDLACEADGRTMTFENLHCRFSYLEDSHPADMPDELMRLWASALLTGRGVIHDTNNINAAVKGFSEMAITDAVSGDPGISSKAIEKFITRLGFISFENAQALSQTAIKLLSDRAGKRGVHVAVGSMPAIAIPQHMRFLLFRCVYELILNAIKYSDSKKPEYLLHVSDPKDRSFRHAAISGRVDGTMLHVTVEDNGVGIADIGRAMRDGVRLRPDLADGTGTGLGIVHSLALGMGGGLHISSHVGVGTTATVSFSMFAASASACFMPAGRI